MQLRLFSEYPGIALNGITVTGYINHLAFIVHGKATTSHIDINGLKINIIIPAACSIDSRIRSP